MKRILRRLAAAALIFSSCALTAAPTYAASVAVEDLPWQEGPGTADIGSRATIQLSENTIFLNERYGPEFLELTGNVPVPGHSVLASSNGWWAAFSFADDGYVKDDEKIDADALLNQLKASDEPSNQVRRKLGLAELRTDSWHTPPHYDPQTRHLQWGLIIYSSDRPTTPVINYTVKMLGRHGYEEAILVTTPDMLATHLVEFKKTLTGFRFNPGHRYTDFVSGDKVAEYGLTALVVGGATAVAAKKGFFKGFSALLAPLWKLIAGVFAVLAIGIANLFGGKRKTEESA